MHRHSACADTSVSAAVRADFRCVLPAKYVFCDVRACKVGHQTVACAAVTVEGERTLIRWSVWCAKWTEACVCEGHQTDDLCCVNIHTRFAAVLCYVARAVVMGHVRLRACRAVAKICEAYSAVQV